MSLDNIGSLRPCDMNTYAGAAIMTPVLCAVICKTSRPCLDNNLSFTSHV